MLLGMATASVGCDASSDRDGDAAADEGSSTKKKRKKKKSDDDDAEVDVASLFDKESSFGGSLDAFGEVMFGAVEHNPHEPDNFSAGWVGKESYDILQRARDNEYQRSQVRTADRRFCLVFKENNTVRRAMLASSQGGPTEELAFANNGNVILWYRHNRDKQNTFEDWAYVHRGNRLALYQTRERGGLRETKNAPSDTLAYVLGGAQQCVTAAKANNFIPGGTTAPPAPTPVSPEPTPGGGNASGSPNDLHFGAFAFSQSQSSWRIAFRKSSEEEARAAALNGCKQSDCVIRTVFTRGQCLSVVHGPPPFVAWAWSTNNNEAQSAAIAECTKNGHPITGCDIKGTWCNDG
jgi:hypothetical protein